MRLDDRHAAPVRLDGGGHDHQVAGSPRAASVSRGDEIAEIETDKATMTYEADSDGVISFVAAEGDTLPIGRVDRAAERRTAPVRRGGGRAGGSGGGSARGRQAGGQLPPPGPARTPAGEPGAASRPPACPSAPPDGEGRVKASPVARRMARGDRRRPRLAERVGAGRADRQGGRRGRGRRGAGGRARSAEAPAPSAPPSAPRPRRQRRGPGAGTAKGEVRVEELSRTQQVIARRMAESRGDRPGLHAADRRRHGAGGRWSARRSRRRRAREMSCRRSTISSSRPVRWR